MEQLPASVTSALRDVAQQTAERVRDRAASTDVFSDVTGLTRKSIRVEEDADDKRFTVEAGDVNHPTGGASVAVWIEYGTKKQPARPFMRPAADAETDRYVRDMTNAAEGTAQEELG